MRRRCSQGRSAGRRCRPHGRSAVPGVRRTRGPRDPGSALRQSAAAEQRAGQGQCPDLPVQPMSIRRRRTHALVRATMTRVARRTDCKTMEDNGMIHIPNPSVGRRGRDCRRGRAARRRAHSCARAAGGSAGPVTGRRRAVRGDRRQSCPDRANSDRNSRPWRSRRRVRSAWPLTSPA